MLEEYMDFSTIPEYAIGKTISYHGLCGNSRIGIRRVDIEGVIVGHADDGEIFVKTDGGIEMFLPIISEDKALNWLHEYSAMWGISWKPTERA